MSNEIIPQNKISCKICGKKPLGKYEIGVLQHTCRECSSPKENPEEQKRIASKQQEIMIGLQTNNREIQKMPAYPVGYSGFPNDLARSSFGKLLATKGKRKYLKMEQIASRNDVKVTYTGEELDMFDISVLLQALVVVQGQRTGEKFIVNRAEFLRSLGKTKGGENYKHLEYSMNRLRATSVMVKGRKRFLITGFIHEYLQNEVTGDFILSIDPRIVPLFNEVCYINLDLFNSLNPLQKKLYIYFASHEANTCQKVSVESLHEWFEIGQKIATWKKQVLTKSLRKLEEKNIIKNLTIDKNIITCETSPTKNQLKTSRNIV